MYTYLVLMRPQQWYKNLVIFTAIFFAGRLFSANDLLITAIGFLALCAASSSGYIVNDILDRVQDRKHPGKRNRPVASRRVSVRPAAVLAGLLLCFSLALATALSLKFLAAVLGLWTLSAAYTLWLKKEPYLDVIVVAANFVIRSAAGAVLISVEISPWLVMCAFFLALLLALGKRYGELRELGTRAPEHRKVFLHYNSDVLMHLISAVLAVLVLSYGFYTFFKGEMMYTLPAVLYGLFRYMHLIRERPDIAANLELAAKDGRMLAASWLWLVLVFVSLYAK